MIGRRDRSKRRLFIAGDIEQFIPDDHIFKIGTAVPILPVERI